MEKEEKLIKVDKEVDDLLAEVARVTNTTKQEVLRELIKNLSEEAKHISSSKREDMDLKDLIKSIPVSESRDSVLSRVTEALATQKLMEKLMDDRNDDVDWDKLLKVMMIKMATQPDLQQLLLYEKLLNRDSNKQDKTSELLAQMMIAQMQQQQQLMATILGNQQKEQQKTFQELKDRTEKMVEELNKRIEMLQNYIMMANNKEEQQTLAEELKKVIEFKNSLKEAAEALGVVEQKEVVDNSGKINWARVLDRALKMGEKVIDKIDKLKAPAPPPKQVVEMPLPQSPQQLQAEIEAVTEETPQEDVSMIVPESNSSEVDSNSNEETEKEILNEEEQTISDGGSHDEETVAEGAGEQDVTEEDDSAGNQEDQVRGSGEGGEE